MSNIVVPVLSVTIGLFFVLVGTIKLTPFISEEFYKEMVGLLRPYSFTHRWRTDAGEKFLWSVSVSEIKL